MNESDTTAMVAITLLLIQRGCPTHLLDEAWSILGAQSVATTPGQIVAQFDAAIARARD